MTNDKYFLKKYHTVPKSDQRDAFDVWDIKYGNPEGSYSSVGHNIQVSVDYDPRGLAYALNSAVEHGKAQAREEVRLALGITSLGGTVDIQ
jgi:hypothetical protein